jgi:hypothetical protein
MRRLPRAIAAAGALALVLLSGAPGAGAGEPAEPPVRIDATQAGALGDGVHDDGPALQAALDRLAQRGGVLELAAGTYEIGAPLVIRGDGITLAGKGATVRASKAFPATPPAALIRTAAGAAAPAAQRRLAILGLTLDGTGRAGGALAIERARDVTVRDVHARRVRAGGGGAIVVRSARDAENDTGEVTVADNVVELDEATSGIVVRNVVNCRVSGNRVQGTDREGSHGIDLTLSRGCTVSDNIVLTADVGILADETNHLQVIGNYVYSARTGFRAQEQPGGKRPASNNVYVNNRVLAGGRGFVVRGSGMVLVGNYAAFLKPGPAIWVQRGGSHDAVVANNPSVAVEGGIRFDASDGVVVANVPISNGAAGIEVNGERVAVTSNAVIANPTGIRLGDGARGCTVLGNSVQNAKDAALALGGRDHLVRDNVGSGAPLPELGRGALYGSGETEVRTTRTTVQGAFPDDRYLVSVEWAADPGGREWITEKTRTGFVIALPAAPSAAVRVRWIARGL